MLLRAWLKRQASLGCKLLTEDCLEQFRRAHRQVIHPDPYRSIHRVGSRGRWRHNRNLAHAPDSQWMIWMGYFNYVGFDEWEVETSRNPIVEEARITHATLLIVEVFLVQSPSEALGGSALHLPFDITRMKRLADVLGYA